MKHLYTILLFWLLCQNLHAQLSDQLWLGGYEGFPGVAGYGHFELRFQNGGLQVQQTPLAFNFESTVAVAADTEGNLLFYSNGCEVANRNHEAMPNGYGLNPGGISDQVCPWKGYIVPQGAMVLPMPGDSIRYCLLHIGAAYEPGRKLRLGPLYYSVVDMSLQNGMGDVAAKNNVLLDADLGNFSAVRHANGRDWWVLAPEFGSTKWHIFLLSPQGLEEMPLQVISLSGSSCEHHGQTSASLDGSMIANWGDCKVTVLGFDRCAGLLGEPLELAAPAHWFAGGGAAFSPSGRYLYTTSHNVLFRADLKASTPKLDTMRFSYGQGPYDVPGNTFHYLVNGPDEKIYGNIPSRARYFHALKNPEGTGIANINFAPQDVQLPVTNVRSLPHFPHYRLYDLPDSPCDTLGINTPVSATRPAGKERAGLAVFPNPAGDWLFLDISDGEGPYYLTITDMLGSNLLQMSEVKATPAVDISQLGQGIYTLLVRAADGKQASRLFVKQ
ncbi:MAG: T9SS type A sorting domain-containing protein [Saprospiraceae bacterium]